MRSAIVAWGSLIYAPRSLLISSTFQSEELTLGIEFSRLSSDGRLTLVIDETDGAPCACQVAVSQHDGLDEALLNLWQREGSADQRTPRNIRGSGRVGFVDVIANTRSAKAMERHPKSVEAIEKWAQDNNFDAAIWTALEPNFTAKRGVPFNVENALSYLSGLTGEARQKAFDYIRNAPDTVKTPLREAFNKRWPVDGG